VEKPTQEQIREFWEWCGFERARFEPTVKGVSKYQYEVGYWVYPDNITDKMIWSQELPSIDLNNLFKYAVPKLDKELALTILRSWVFNILTTKPAKDNPALALFWPIYKVMKGGEIREEQPRINSSG